MTSPQPILDQNGYLYVGMTPEYLNLLTKILLQRNSAQVRKYTKKGGESPVPAKQHCEVRCTEVNGYGYYYIAPMDINNPVYHEVKPVAQAYASYDDNVARNAAASFTSSFQQLHVSQPPQPQQQQPQPQQYVQQPQPQQYVQQPQPQQLQPSPFTQQPQQGVVTQSPSPFTA